MRPFGGSEWTSQTVYVDSEAPNGLLKLCISIRRLRIDFSTCFIDSEAPNGLPNLFYRFGGSEWTSRLVLSIRRLRMDFSTCFIYSEAPNRPLKLVLSIRRLRIDLSDLFYRFGGSESTRKKFFRQFGGSECDFQTV